MTVAQTEAGTVWLGRSGRRGVRVVRDVLVARRVFVLGRDVVMRAAGEPKPLHAAPENEHRAEEQRGHPTPRRGHARRTPSPVHNGLRIMPRHTRWGNPGHAAPVPATHGGRMQERRRRNRTSDDAAQDLCNPVRCRQGIRSVGAECDSVRDQLPRRRSLAHTRLQLADSDKGSPPWLSGRIGRNGHKVQLTPAGEKGSVRRATNKPCNTSHRMKLQVCTPSPLSRETVQSVLLRLPAAGDFAHGSHHLMVLQVTVAQDLGCWPPEILEPWHAFCSFSTGRRPAGVAAEGGNSGRRAFGSRHVSALARGAGRSVDRAAVLPDPRRVPHSSAQGRVTARRHGAEIARREPPPRSVCA